MTNALPELDPALEARFRNEHRHLPDEPFVKAVIKRVAAKRARVATIRHLLQGGALIAVTLASPWLIEGSVLLSNGLDWAFAQASRWLAMPLGVAAAALLGGAGWLLYRGFRKGA